MTLPGFLIGAILATLYGAFFHLWRGGGIGRLFVYIIASWIGFWTGQFLADRTGWTFLSIGQLHLGLATLISLIFLGLAYWLGRYESNP